VTVVERHFVLVRHRRQKYRCKCNSAIVTAPMPPRLIPGGRYSVEFAIDVAVAKYLDHMPLERQVRVMQREGLKIDSQTLQQRGGRESGLRKAIEYMLGRWPGLVRFLDDLRVPLDNNQVERALRGAVIGRKNHYGSRWRRGTEVAAIFYSLLESAKACGVDEQTYLLRAAHTDSNRRPITIGLGPRRSIATRSRQHCVSNFSSAPATSSWSRRRTSAKQ
jgi:hypothetical protein